eukprot:TRINITY_DN80596_c0_g1_i1.p1 TRINITY_DN80596_c0_g1~~TRINITY_DN80596_c0_g1_i1.p1  ORF type:complete len:351 (-),score=53.74 TRINITY_DN80596_c0_g1_i1:108-1160(-)
MLDERARGLPTKPVRDLPEDYCLLDGLQFSFLPQKHRAEISLPPMKSRAMSDTCLGSACSSRRAARPVRRGKTKTKEPLLLTHSAANRCFGDFCDAQIRFPGSLKDIESSNDPWMMKAWELCQKELKLPSGETLARNLLEPEELVACQEERERDREQRDSDLPGGGMAQQGPSRPSATHSRVCASLILEARSHPILCSWLQDNGWRLDLHNVDAVAATAARLREDDQFGRGDVSRLTDSCSAGLRYRLRERPVCRTCFHIYTIIHTAINMIRVQRKDLWAERELQKRALSAEMEREKINQDITKRMLAIQQQRRPQSAPKQWGQANVLRQRRSRFLDEDVEEWLRTNPDL